MEYLEESKFKQSRRALSTQNTCVGGLVVEAIKECCSSMITEPLIQAVMATHNLLSQAFVVATTILLLYIYLVYA